MPAYSKALAFPTNWRRKRSIGAGILRDHPLASVHGRDEMGGHTLTPSKIPPQTTMFVCGADVTFRGDHQFATYFFGPFATVHEAVIENKRLHPSFGYVIYEISPVITKKLVRAYGMRSGTPCSGHRIIRKALHAFEHPAWENSISPDVQAAEA